VIDTIPIDCPYYLISRVTLFVTSALKKGFADAGVTTVKPAYLGVLLTLWREDGLKVIDLGRKAGLEPSSMTGLLDRMERDALLYRKADPSDRRAQRIHLTKTGRETKTPVLKVVDKILAGVFKGIHEQDIRHTKNILQRVLTNAQEGNR
jgi:MarR family transcriptional regulator, organic hydroperoxide resistance regulator